MIQSGMPLDSVIVADIDSFTIEVSWCVGDSPATPPPNTVVRRMSSVAHDDGRDVPKQFMLVVGFCIL